VPLAGFFAKDEILVAANDFNVGVLILILITLPLTAAYMLRVYMLTFLGEPKDHHAYEHAHESPPVMSWPLIALAVLAVVAGFVVFEPIGKAIGLESGFLGFVDNVLVADVEGFSLDWPMAIISTVLVGGGLVFAWNAWSGEMALAKDMGARFPWAYTLARNKFYIDDFYQWVINNVILGLAKVVALFDRLVINDTGVNGPGQATSLVAYVLRYTQTGKLPNYALGMIVGIAVFVVAAFTVKG
jgi:NADH-quinone oxidoreductase subunit L